MAETAEEVEAETFREEAGAMRSLGRSRYPRRPAKEDLHDEASRADLGEVPPGGIGDGGVAFLDARAA